MTLTAIVVYYDSENRLQACLNSIQASAQGLPHEIVVVSNASVSPRDSMEKFSLARWILNEKNVGWGAAVNRAARESSGDVLVLVNPDAELLPDALRALDRFFHEHSAEPIGPVGGRLLFSDGRLQPSCGPFPHLASLLWRLPLAPYIRKYYIRSPGGAPARVDWVTGAFMAVRRSVFDRLGGFDLDFFLYYEDVDFCLRSSRAGFPSWYAPEAAAYHHNPYAIRKGSSPELKRIIQGSRLAYFEKHRPAWEVVVLKGLHKLEKIS